MDVLDKEGVQLAAWGYSPIPALEKDGVALSFGDAVRTTAYNNSQPPNDWDAFLAEATDIFVAKDRDYGSRFMRALMDVEKDPRTLWAWEVEKKLDRIRTWMERGELAVKGEGVKDSVLDLFVYTVQYGIYHDCRQLNIDPLTRLNERDFYSMAARSSAKTWLIYLTNDGLIGRVEWETVSVILKYMGIPNG
jgi:hypothetical protein